MVRVEGLDRKDTVESSSDVQVSLASVDTATTFNANNVNSLEADTQQSTVDNAVIQGINNNYHDIDDAFTDCQLFESLTRSKHTFSCCKQFVQ